MLIVLLPGFSSKNEDEMLNIQKAFDANGYQTYAHHWRHWTNDRQPQSLAELVDIELPSIQEAVGNQSYILIAKSWGGFVGLNLVNTLDQDPELTVFMGVGANDLSDEEAQQYPDILGQASFPKVFVHNTDDDHGSAEQLKQILGDLDCNLEEIPGNTHRYNYPDKLLDIIQSYTALDVLDTD